MSATDPRPSAGETPASPSDPRVLALARLVGIVDRLRAVDGCPWDRKQTLASMAPHLVEEAHEALEAVETGDDLGTAEECGDLLMAVTLLVRIAEDTGRFDLAAVGQAVCDKLVRRHPHVFGDVQATSAEEVLVNWEAIKKREREGKQIDASALAGVPAALPALQRAQRVCGKAVSAGFRWTNAAGALAKLDEEVGELHSALADSGLVRDASASVSADPSDGLATASAEQRARVEAELGDVLMAAAFFATYLKLDPEQLCRAAVRRFEARFRSMERELDGQLAERSLDELMAAWERAKLAAG